MKTTSGRRRWILVAVAAAVVALLTISLLRSPAIPVELARVDRGPLIVTVDSPGRTRVVDRYTIPAPVTGRISRIELREGASVERGQQLASIQAIALDPRARAESGSLISGAESGASAARASVARAEAELQLASSEARRIASLAEEGVSSAQALEEARTREEVARRTLAAARADLQSATSEIERTRAAAGQGSAGRELAITAPSSGTILRIPDRSARPVTAGETLLEIGDARQIEAVVDFLSEDAVRIQPGSRVILRDWGGPRELEGRVRLVEPSGFTKISALGIEEQRVNVIIDINDAPPALGDGFRVDAAVVVWSDPQALRVPIAALGRSGEQWSVMAVAEGRAVRRTLRIGERNDEHAQVLAGLDEGDTVILHPSSEIGDGTKVKSVE